MSSGDDGKAVAFLKTHGVTTEAHLQENAFWLLKRYLRATMGATLAATRTGGAHFTVNGGPPRSLARVVGDANAEARRRGDPLFDLAEVERAWRAWTRRGGG